MERDIVWQIGQRLMTGFEGTEISQTLRDAVHTYKIGNIILFEHNVENKEQLRRLCAELQALVQAETGTPALIAIDQEGGIVSRLKGDCAVVPSAMCVSATGKPENAYTAGKLTGEELAALGVNFDLAPVLDVNSNRKNVVIGTRSYGESPKLVATYGVAMSRGLQAGGVLSCGKHFPGHGDTAVDSHLGLPLVEKSLEELEACELIPFRAAIDADIDAMMTTHILFPKLEKEKIPATMSRTIMTGLLRERLGFKGLIISDCMMMGAIQDYYGTIPGCVAACKAGVDMVIISHSAELAGQAAQAIREEAEKGGVLAEEMDAAMAHIAACKARLHPADPAAFDAVGSAAHREIVHALRQAGATHLGGAAQVPALGDKPFFVGCYPFRVTLVSSPVDTHVCFPTWLMEQFGGDSLVTDTNPSDEEVARAVEAAKGHSCIVLGTYNGCARPGQKHLMEALEALQIPMVCVALRNPDDLKGLPEHAYGLEVYEYSISSLEIVAEVLRGDLIPAGKLPVTLEEQA